jgi:hypothetical protein
MDAVSLEQVPYVGTRNVVLTGVSTHFHASNAGTDPISIKAVCAGQVEWRFEGQRYLIQPDVLLLMPDGDEYELTIDSIQPSRGFNTLFRRGLVEDCWRSMFAKHEVLLDVPYELKPLSFSRRLESRYGALGLALNALVAAVAARAAPDAVEQLFETLGERAAQSICEQRRERRRPPGLKLTTQREIYRRLCLAREVVQIPRHVGPGFHVMPGRHSTACRASIPR